MALAAAMTLAIAISGTLIFLVVSRQRPSGHLPAADPPPASPPPCIVDPKRRSERRAAKTGKRRVCFAERVTERYIEDAGEEDFSATAVATERGGAAAAPAIPPAAMPANWVALYSGMLRDRHRRVVCSY